MVFGLIRKADDTNFQSFEDSGICSFQEERNELLFGPAISGDGNDGREHSSSRHMCDLLGGLLGDDQLEQDLDDDLLGGSPKNNLTARPSQNLLRAPSLKVELPPLPAAGSGNHSDGATSAARNHEFLRAPSMDRENEYVGIIEESNSESSETSEETEYGIVSAPVQFELPPGGPSIPVLGSSTKSLDCLENLNEQSASSVNDYNVSITFTTCFDTEDDFEENPPTDVPLNVDLVDISELEAKQIIDGETARRIREHLQQKRGKETVSHISAEKENQGEKIESKGTHRVRKHRSPSHNGKTGSSKSEERYYGSGSPSRRHDRKKSPHLSPDQSRSKVVHDKDVPTRRSPRKTDGSEDSPSRRGSRKGDENHLAERRKSNHSSSRGRAATEVVSEHLSATRATPDQRRSKDGDLLSEPSIPLHELESSPTRCGHTKGQNEGLTNDGLYSQSDRQSIIEISGPQVEECDYNIDEKKRKSLLGSPGKMMMKFLSQRNVVDDRERPTFRRSESQTEIGTPLSEIDEKKMPSQSHGRIVRSDGTDKHNEQVDEAAILDCSNRSSPRTSNRFASWILQGRRPSISNSGEIHEKESITVSHAPNTDVHLKENIMDVSNRSTRRRSSAKMAELEDPDLENSKAAPKIDNHFLQSHLISDNHVQYNQSKIRPAIMRSSSLDVLYSPVKNTPTEVIQKLDEEKNDLAKEQSESISSLKRNKPTRRRSVSVGTNAGDDGNFQNVVESAESSNEKVSSHKRREQSISPAKRSALSAASKQKKDLSQTQHPQSKQTSIASARTPRARDLSNSCHVLKSENGHRNDSPSQRSPGSRPLSKNEAPDSPSKRRSSLTHQKGLSFSVHVSPTKRKSGTSTVVTRRLSALASAPIAEPPLLSTNGALTSTVGLDVLSNDDNPVPLSDPLARGGKERIKVVGIDQESSKALTDSTAEVRQQRAFSQSVHLSPAKRKNGLNTGASRRSQSTVEPSTSYKVKRSPDNVMSPDHLYHPSGALKSTNGTVQPSTRTRKATIDDLKKDFEYSGECDVNCGEVVGGGGNKNQEKSNNRKIHLFTTKK